MTNSALKLAVIIGSVREGRFAPVVAEWFGKQLADRGDFDVDWIDLAEQRIPLELPPTPPAIDPDLPRPAYMDELTRRMARADAYVILTPEYNRSFPASLKSAIDWYCTEWQAKAVGFVGYSGGTGGVLAIEQLRQVFGEVRAHSVREYVSFPRYYVHLEEDGSWNPPEYNAADASRMLDELLWWGKALRDARSRG
ncbi:NAD(P)H-dependent oxidoreductase [Streptomyces sp. A7024]|uniref:NAD(P)H-dependent oxidoreductase n=1 Tax=Streptomyces coryli TaxID=1128680 RepID=A0A6G4U9Q4_9ACTN|nr:NAD(P)H-dependent oxidoreductase [Streptomyces coryli]NGN68914.1 NAD(P)H-dependent oxidoreductase [Streptomyces coryli]